MVLSKNNFQFNGEHYLQIGGTSMGTKAVVGFAINFLGWFEKTFVYTNHKQPLMWIRYKETPWRNPLALLRIFLRIYTFCCDDSYQGIISEQKWPVCEIKYTLPQHKNTHQ